MTERSGDDQVAPTMRAVTRHAYGSADVLEVEDIERPTIASDEVLVEVDAAGLDQGVWHLMAGMPYLVRLAGYGITKPKEPVIGMDVAGRVVEVGSEVTRFAEGDEVFGIATGGFAEYAVVKETKLVHKPANITFEQAAVTAVSGITALQALTTVGRVEAGQAVLVIGAAGGVGSYAVQLAKALGATVTGVGSTDSLDLMRELGAEHVIDYTCQDFVDLDRRFDLIIDTGGRNSLSRLRQALTPRGTLVIVGGEGGGRIGGGIGRQLRAVLMSVFIKQRLTFFISEESIRYLEPLAQHLADGDVTPAVGQRFTLDEVPRAIRLMRDGKLKGKTAITVRS